MKIEQNKAGSHFLLQAKDVDGDHLSYRTDALVRFDPVTSRNSWILKRDDLLFMARGSRNYSILLNEIPNSTLAAACFFIIRVKAGEILPGYLHWYLNQAPVMRYLMRHSGRGVSMPVVTRSVLEGIDVPVIPVETQQRIVEIGALMSAEQELLNSLAVKSRELMVGVCLQAVKRISTRGRTYERQAKA
ncbi:MAG: restriction endonuclease subunit S [Thermodesulfobacteriota bacterium]